MAKAGKSQVNINLGSYGQKTVGVVFYQWAITVGKTIIVLVELTALAALGYRFVIDRQIVDQNDEIAKQETLIEAQSDRENAYRATQVRLTHVKATQDNTTRKFVVMNEVLKAVRAGTFFSTNLSISEKSAAFNGTTFSIQTLANFIESLKQLPVVSGISVNEVSTSSEGVQFEILIDMSESQNAS